MHMTSSVDFVFSSHISALYKAIAVTGQVVLCEMNKNVVHSFWPTVLGMVLSIFVFLFDL